MNNTAVLRHKQRLDSTFKAAAKLNSDSELQSHWGKYCCVLASGFVEESVRTLISNYAAVRSHSKLHRFIGSDLKRFQNADMEKILNLLDRFDPSIKDTFEKQLDDKDSSAVTSLVSVRHSIAHGGASGISLSTVSNYYSSAITVIETLEKVLSAS